MANLIVEAVPPDQTGVATGMNTIVRTIGGAIGAQIAASILTATATAAGVATERGFTIAFYRGIGQSRSRSAWGWRSPCRGGGRSFSSLPRN